MFSFSRLAINLDRVALLAAVRFSLSIRAVSRTQVAQLLILVGLLLEDPLLALLLRLVVFLVGAALLPLVVLAARGFAAFLVAQYSSCSLCLSSAVYRNSRSSKTVQNGYTLFIRRAQYYAFSLLRIQYISIDLGIVGVKARRVSQRLIKDVKFSLERCLILSSLRIAFLLTLQLAYQRAMSFNRSLIVRKQLILRILFVVVGSLVLSYS